MKSRARGPRSAVLGLAAAAWVALAPAALAAQTKKPPPPAAKTAPAEASTDKSTPATPAEPVRPYERELLRLAEVMGALAFLRPLCGAADGDEWRQRMSTLVEAEGTTTEWKELLAGAYNKGYRAFALTYRRCTPAAATAIERYLAEGQALSRTVATRYGS